MVDMFSWMNALTGDTPGLFGLLILISVFMISFILNAKKETEVAFAMASWITMLTAIFLSMLQGSMGYLIPGNYVAVCVTISAISVVVLYINR